MYGRVLDHCYILCFQQSRERRKNQNKPENTNVNSIMKVLEVRFKVSLLFPENKKIRQKSDKIRKIQENPAIHQKIHPHRSSESARSSELDRNFGSPDLLVAGKFQCVRSTKIHLDPPNFNVCQRKRSTADLFGHLPKLRSWSPGAFYLPYIRS